MFNTFLTNILNSYLGEVVEDLDMDNLGIGALNGDILLIDLKLRPDALVGSSQIATRKLGLPASRHKVQKLQERFVPPRCPLDISHHWPYNLHIQKSIMGQDKLQHVSDLLF